MEQALRPHHARLILVLGAIAFALALAIAAWSAYPSPSSFRIVYWPTGILILALGAVSLVLGWREVRGMKAKVIDPSGRRQARLGQALGAVGLFGWTGLTIAGIMLAASALDGATWTIPMGATGTRTTYYEGGSVECEGSIRLRPQSRWPPDPDDSYLDGPFIRWNRDHTVKLEEGAYAQGKRVGEWVFRREDGSVDAEESGRYEDGIRVEAGVTPSGNLDPETPR